MSKQSKLSKHKIYYEDLEGGLWGDRVEYPSVLIGIVKSIHRRFRKK